MNLKSINDQLLIQQTENLVREERGVLTKILHYLREIDRRRLFSDLKFKSLFDFTVKHLGYPEDQAYRRISAMKLLKELPEIENKINLGEVTLTHINLAQTLFRKEKKNQNKEMSLEQKRSVLERIANKPVREAEKITLSLSSAPELMKPDRINQISENTTEIKFVASKDIQLKIERLKGLLAHKYPNISLGELFEKLCDLGLFEWNPTKMSSEKIKIENGEVSKAGEVNLKVAAPRKRHVINKISQAQLMRNIFERAKNQCENCNSTFALEIDHIHPKARGGLSNFENLRVLCRTCNQRAAVKQFGLQKMDRFINAKL